MKHTSVHAENIIPACFAETILMQTIGHNCHKNHQKGDGNAINTFTKLKSTKAIAVMDRPVGTAPSQINSDFKDVKKGTHHLILKKNKTKEHYIIYIDKVLEEWIFDLGKSSGIKGPYKSVEALKKELKPSTSLNNKKLLKYFNDIYSKNPVVFKTINQWIKEVNK